MAQLPKPISETSRWVLPSFLRFIVSPMPGLKTYPHRIVTGIGKPEMIFRRMLDQPLVFNQFFKKCRVFFSAHAVLTDKINGLLLRITVLAVSGKSVPLGGFSDRIAVLNQIKNKQIKLVSWRTVAGFHIKPPRSE